MIAALAATTFVLRAVGPVALGGRALPKRALRVAGLLAPVLFGAFVATQVFSTERALVVDERTVGLAAAATALAARAPMPVVLAAAALATALARSLG